jgi:hypothetical protein
LPETRTSALIQLQHTDDFILMIFHLHGQKRMRAVTSFFVEALNTTEIKPLRGIGVGDIHRLVVVDGIGRVHLQFFRSVLPIQVNRVNGSLQTGSAHASQHNAIVANYGELQRFVVGQAVERPAIHVGDVFRAQ